jgi:hypothetical protein
LVGHRAIEPPSVPGEIRVQYESAIETIARSRDALTGTVVLSFAPDAARLFHAFRTDLERRRGPGGDLAYLATWASKLDGATARLAGLLHIARDFAAGFGRPIDATTMEAALRLASYLIPHARVAFDQMGADVHRDDARAVLDWLRREDLRTFTRRQALRALQGRFPNVATLKPALDLLADHGWIRDMARSVGPGRPSITYEVTPYLHDSTTEPTQPTETGSAGGSVSSVSMSIEATFKPSSSVSDGTDADGPAATDADGSAPPPDAAPDDVDGIRPQVPPGGDNDPAAVADSITSLRDRLEAGEFAGLAPIRLTAGETINDVPTAARRWVSESEGDGMIAANARSKLEQLAAAIRASETAP